MSSDDDNSRCEISRLKNEIRNLKIQIESEQTSREDDLQALNSLKLQMDTFIDCLVANDALPCRISRLRHQKNKSVRDQDVFKSIFKHSKDALMIEAFMQEIYTMAPPPSRLREIFEKNLKSPHRNKEMFRVFSKIMEIAVAKAIILTRRAVPYSSRVVDVTRQLWFYRENTGEIRIELDDTDIITSAIKMLSTQMRNIEHIPIDNSDRIVSEARRVHAEAFKYVLTQLGLEKNTVARIKALVIKLYDQDADEWP